MEVLAQRFGPHHLLGATLKVSTMLDDTGRIVHLSGVQDLSYGELDGSMTPRIRALDEFLQGAGFDARLSPVIRREMWEKWVLLAALGGITCLMRGPIGAVEAAPGGAEFALRFLDEVVAVVNAVGERPAQEFLLTVRQVLTTKQSPLTSSMNHVPRLPPALLAALACLPAGGVMSAAASPQPATQTTPAAVAAITVGQVHLHRCDTPAPWCGVLERALDPSGVVAGTVPVYFEYYPHGAPGSATGTLVATEGGPGYPATESREEYLALFEPLRSGYDVLIMMAQAEACPAGVT